MNCPRCCKVMLEFEGVSQPSQLERQDEVHALIVHGFRCWNCGEWREAEVVPVKPMPAQEEAEKRYSVAITSQAFHVVERFFDSIDGLRQGGASWYTVSKLMLQAGYRCQEKTLQKYFEIEQARRCGDGQAA